MKTTKLTTIDSEVKLIFDSYENDIVSMEEAKQALLKLCASKALILNEQGMSLDQAVQEAQADLSESARKIMKGVI